VHLNPQVREPVLAIMSGLPNVTLLEPLDYLSLIQLMRQATLVLTDSGGIQEEAPSLGVPVLVLRDTTERPEGVEAGVAELVGTSPESITASVSSILGDPGRRAQMTAARNPYGDGKAALRIVTALMERSKA
jgi:UDP-N-acetylglucosamine 2-epimerase (non-hydrolysing)